MEMLTVVVEPEENGEEDAEWQCDEDFANGDVPRIDYPARATGRHKRDTRRQCLKVDVLHAPNVHEASEEDERKRRAVVLQEHAHHVGEQATRAQNTTEVGYHEDKEGGNNGQVKSWPWPRRSRTWMPFWM